MKPFGWRWLVFSSLLLATLACADTRPQYGGTLRVSMRAALTSLDPSERSLSDSIAQRNIAGLMFDTLVITDKTGRIRPALADSWQSTNGNQSYQLHLRPAVKLSDGSPLTTEIVAASLRFANPGWRVLLAGDSVIVESENPTLDLLLELTLARNSIVKRGAIDGRLLGTGPFRIATWEPGKHLALDANDEYWGGRPFLDGIEVNMGRSFRDQSNSLQLGRSDLVEVAPEQAQHMGLDSRRSLESHPVELLALLFPRDAASPDEKNLRDALTLSVERNSIHDVLLKRSGSSTGSLLPNWMTGYGFVFRSASDLARAQQLRSAVKSVPSWKLAYDGNDPLDRLLAERIALNARDAGLSVQPVVAASADIRLVRISLESSDPWIALDDLLNRCGISTTASKGASIQDLYATEQNALGKDRVIPLFYLPVSYASSPALRDWNVRADGALDLSNAWLEILKP